MNEHAIEPCPFCGKECVLRHWMPEEGEPAKASCNSCDYQSTDFTSSKHEIPAGMIEHNQLCALLRQRDALLSVMENIVSNLRWLADAPRREQLEHSINTSVIILDGVIAKCKENQ